MGKPYMAKETAQRVLYCARAGHEVAAQWLAPPIGACSASGASGTGLHLLYRAVSSQRARFAEPTQLRKPSKIRGLEL